MKKNIKNNIKQLIYFLLIFVVFSGCSDNFLEEKPDNRTLIKTLDEMDKTVKSLNPIANYLFTEVMTDTYQFKSLPAHVNQRVLNMFAVLYTFTNTRDNLLRADYGINDFNPNISWVSYYYRIQNAFLIISKASEYVPKNTEEKKLKNSIIGRALAIKAYCNFMLVNLFAKDYNPATAGDDSGVPLMLKYTGKALEKYPVASVKETYDNIEADLLKAQTLLKDNDVTTNKKFNFTTISVNALLSRFYLFKEDWAKAVEYADLVISKNNSILNVKDLTDQYGGSQSEEYGKQFFNPDNPSYLLVSDNTFQLISFHYSNFFPYSLVNFMISKGRNLVDTNEFIATNPLFADKIPTKTLYFSNGPAGRNTGVFPLLSVDETYYNRAEANIELGNLDKAKSDIKLLLAKDNYYNTQWTGLVDGITDKQALMNYLLDSKRMRFYAEGMRWFDIRRHAIPLKHNFKGKDYIIDGTKPEDYVIKFPSEELNKQQ